MSTEPFGFEVHVTPWVDHDPDFDVVRDKWSVDLPHQCDEWSIGFGAKDEVAADLRRFIAEAMAALDRLEEIEPCPHDWIDDNSQHVSNAGTERLHRCSKCSRSVWVVVDRSTARPGYYKKAADADS